MSNLKCPQDHYEYKLQAIVMATRSSSDNPAGLMLYSSWSSAWPQTVPAGRILMYSAEFYSRRTESMDIDRKKAVK